MTQRSKTSVLLRSAASGLIFRFGGDAGFEDYRRHIEELAAC